MPDYITIAISSTVSFAAGYWAHILTTRRDSTSRRRGFRAHLSTVHADLQAAPDEDLFARHQAFIPKVRDECARALEDIRLAHRWDFSRASTAYCTIKQQDMEPEHAPKEWAGEAIQFTFPEDYQQARRRLTVLLTEMIGYAR